MIRKVTRYQTTDGLMFDELYQAELHEKRINARYELEYLFEGIGLDIKTVLARTVMCDMVGRPHVYMSALDRIAREQEERNGKIH